jgi:hypothetical protein
MSTPQPNNNSTKIYRKNIGARKKIEINDIKRFFLVLTWYLVADRAVAVTVGKQRLGDSALEPHPQLI